MKNPSQIPMKNSKTVSKAIASPDVKRDAVTFPQLVEL